MGYYSSKIVNYSFEETLSKLSVELKKEGFGILSEIDVKEILKNKLQVEFRKYKILGACNPTFAHKALQLEENLGVLLPCNVVVQEKEENIVQVSIVDPQEALKRVENEKIDEVANEISAKLKRVLEGL